MEHRIIKNIGIILLLATCGFYGCYYDNEQDLYGLEVCDVEDVTFSQHIEPIISNNCATPGCHVPGNGRVLLRNYNEILQAVEGGGLRDRTVVQKDMPPSGQLLNCEIAEIDRWISDGAPNN